MHTHRDKKKTGIFISLPEHGIYRRLELHNDCTGCVNLFLISAHWVFVFWRNLLKVLNYITAFVHEMVICMNIVYKTFSYT